MFHPPELWDILLTRSRVEGGVRLWPSWVFEEGSSGNAGIAGVGSVTAAVFLIGQNKPLLRVLHRKLSHCCCLASDLLNTCCCVGCLEVIIVLGKKTKQQKPTKQTKKIQMKKQTIFLLLCKGTFSLLISLIELFVFTFKHSLTTSG